MERLLAAARFEFGRCRLGKLLEVTGPDTATFALACDKGNARLTLSLDRGLAPIVAFRVSPGGPLAACR